MEFTKVIRGRSSIRHFSAIPVTDEEIEIVLEEAKWAPSAGNLQPWKLKVLSPELSQEFISELEVLGWESVFSSLRTAIASHSLQGADSHHLNELAVETFHRQVKSTGSPRIVAVYEERPNWSVRWASANSRISIFRHRLKSQGTLLRKLKYTWMMLGRIRGDNKIVRHTQSASIAAFTYGVTLSAFNRGLATCIQFSYNSAYPQVKKFLHLKTRDELFGIVLIGRQESKEEVAAVSSRTRRDLCIKWLRKAKRNQGGSRGDQSLLSSESVNNKL